MIPRDAVLSENMLAYEYARKYRHLFELAMAVLVALTTTVLSKWGSGYAFPVYLYIASITAFAETVRQGIRAFGQAKHMGEACEYTKAMPFCFVTLYMLAWLGTSELLLATGALAEPFRWEVAVFQTIFMLAGALYFTWTGPTQIGIDGATAFAWFMLMFPTVSASVRTSTTVAALIRVTGVMSMCWLLGVRDEGRMSAVRWTHVTRESAQQVIATGMNVAAFRLVQSVWILHCTPMVFLVAGIMIFVFNETRVTPAIRSVGDEEDAANL